MTLKFPSEKDYAFAKLTVHIGDKVIEGKVLKKLQAIWRFENAVAGGHTVVMAEKGDGADIVIIKLGNLLGG